MTNNKAATGTPMGPLIMDVDGHTLTDEDRELLAHPFVGGVILFTRNFQSREQVADLVAAMRAARPNGPLLINVDHEGGRVQRFRGQGFTTLPAAPSLLNIYANRRSHAIEAAVELGWLMACELRAADIDLSWAPVLDLATGASEVIGDRAFGGDSETIADLAGGYAAGMLDAGMAATGKHFPGHGSVVGDSHHLLPVDKRDAAAIAQDMQPFKTLLPRLAAVMVAHVVYPQVDEQPASFSKRWIQATLRDELGFTGAVVADDLTMGGAATMGDYVTRVKGSLVAGCDWLPLCNNRDGVKSVLAAVDAGEIAETDTEAAERRALLLPRELAPASHFHTLPRWQAAKRLAEALQTA